MLLELWIRASEQDELLLQTDVKHMKLIRHEDPIDERERETGRAKKSRKMNGPEIERERQRAAVRAAGSETDGKEE